MSNVYVLRPQFNPHLGGYIRMHPHRPDDGRTCYYEIFPTVGRFMTVSLLKRMVTSGMLTRGHGIIHRGPWIENRAEALKRGCFQFFYRRGLGIFDDCLLELEVQWED